MTGHLLISTKRDFCYEYTRINFIASGHTFYRKPSLEVSMKRSLYFAFFAIAIGIISLGATYFTRYFYPENYVKDKTGNYINITVSENNSTFPVNKSTVFNVEYDYPEEGRLLKEQLKCIPALLGCDKEGVEKYLNDYMNHLSREDREKGLVSYKMISYNSNEITLRKTFRSSTTDGFYAKSFNGLIVILKSDEKTVYEYTQISISSLPEDIREDILKGYYLENEEELYNFLENYTS